MKNYELIKELTEKAEAMFPTNLAEQFRVVRSYATGPCFDTFCEIKNITPNLKRRLAEILN